MKENAITGWAILMHEFREHLAVWYIYSGSIGMLLIAIAIYPDEMFYDLGLPRSRFPVAMILQMMVFTVYMGKRIVRSSRVKQKRTAGLVLAVLAIGIPAAVIFGCRPFYFNPGFLKILFEIQTFLFVAVFTVQILWKRGASALLLFFGVTSIYGLILENTGIIMGYFFEPGYMVYLGRLPAPLCNVVGWPLMFYVMFSLTERFASWWPWLGARTWARALTTTGLALCNDAQMDPLASLSGLLWRWNELLEPAFLGVPALNFVAWTGAFLPFSWIVFRILDRTDITPIQKSWELFLRIPLASSLGGMICFGVMAVLEGGFNGPTYQILDNLMKCLLPY